MRSAPAVHYPLDPGRLGARIQTLLGLTSLAFVVVCVWLQDSAWFAFLALSACLPGLWLSWRAQAEVRIPGKPRHLSWDGDSWWWSCGDMHLPGRVRVVMDLQAALLLEFSSPSSSPGPSVQWLWVQRRVNPAGWTDLRRAVYCLAP